MGESADVFTVKAGSPVVTNDTLASQPIDVLVIDQDPGQRRVLAAMIANGESNRFRVAACTTAADIDAVGCDMSEAVLIADVDTLGGPSHIADIVRTAPHVIATSASGSLSMAVAAVKAGAVSFLTKPIGAKALIEGLETAIASWNDSVPERQPAVTTPGASTDAFQPDSDYAGFVGRSTAMRGVYQQIRRMAPSRAPVFITGESGTGKEICAEAIHTESGANERPFVAINCSAIPHELIESEIFGHVRGAFTGASDNRPGAAELADGGTLFLDEIAEMDLSLQAKLLRFVQTGSFRRVGGSDLKHVDVRIVSATNRSPEGEVEAGRFRADLFYRLHVLPIALPPLRDRREDIPDLAASFLARFATEEGRTFRGFADAALESLCASPWPGNVRQLQNVIRRIVVLNDHPTVTLDMLPGDLLARTDTGRMAASHADATPTIAPFHDQERRIIETALDAFDGNVQRTAAALEINPSTIYRKRQAWLDRMSA